MSPLYLRELEERLGNCQLELEKAQEKASRQEAEADEANEREKNWKERALRAEEVIRIRKYGSVHVFEKSVFHAPRCELKADEKREMEGVGEGEGGGGSITSRVE